VIQHFGPALKRTTLAVLSSALLTAPLLLAQPQSATKGAVLLVDTDDTCRLVLDDEDKGVITPAQSQKFTVSLGEHILKCAIESAPDLVWRKVIQVKDSSQVAAAISLKALHLQYDQAITKAKNERDATAATAQNQLEVAKLAEKEREAAKGEAPQKLFDTVQGNWKLLVQNGDQWKSYLVNFKALNGDTIVTAIQIEQSVGSNSGGRITGHKQTSIGWLYKATLRPVPPNLLKSDGSPVRVLPRIRQDARGLPRLPARGHGSCIRRSYR
jgi:hypothetical protein